MAAFIVSAKTPQSSDYVANLKEFLGADYPQYEALFSFAPHDNPGLWQPGNGSAAPALTFHEATTFYRLRRAQDGFFLATGENLETVRSFVIRPQNSASGVFSNSVYWVFGNQMLFKDTAKIGQLKAQNRTWTNLLEDSAHHIRTLGLEVRPGSIVWSGMDFTAEASEDLATAALVPPNAEGKRILSGRLATSNGLPSVIYYQSPACQFEVHFTYKNPVIKERLGIPDEMLAVTKFPSGIVSSQSLELFDFRLLDFPPGSTGPEDYTNSNKTGMLINLGSNGPGTRTMTKTGVTLPNFTGGTRKPATRITILLAFIFITIGVFVLWICRSKSS